MICSTFYKYTWTCLTHCSLAFTQPILTTGKSSSSSFIFFLNHTVLRLLKWQMSLLLVQVKMLSLWSRINFSCLQACKDISMRISFTRVSHNKKRHWSSLTAHRNTNDRWKWGGVQYGLKLCYWDTVVCSGITLLQWIYYCVTNSICLFSLFLFRMIQRWLRFNNDELSCRIKNGLVNTTSGVCLKALRKPKNISTHTIQLNSRLPGQRTGEHTHSTVSLFQDIYLCAKKKMACQE
jgi:hypothetical protein